MAVTKEEGIRVQDMRVCAVVPTGFISENRKAVSSNVDAIERHTLESDGPLISMKHWSWSQARTRVEGAVRPPPPPPFESGSHLARFVCTLKCPKASC